MRTLLKSLFCFLILTAVVSTGFAQAPGKMGKKTNADAGYKIGDTAADFNLKNVDGNMYSLSQLEDAKGYIIIFTSNVCPFAVMYEDRIKALHTQMSAKGYPVIAINPNDPAAEEGDSFAHMQTKASEDGWSFLYLKDEGQKIYPKFGASKTPHVFILDKDLVVQYIGAIDDNAQSAADVEVKYVEDAIAALEKGEAPNPSETKAIGCSIKTVGGGKGSGKRGRRGPPQFSQLLETMDADNDSKISSAEAQGRIKDSFSTADTNEDGFITKEEFEAFKPGKRGGKRPKQ